MERENRVEHVGLLNAVEDSYGGVTVKMKEPMDSKDFVPLLRASISQWRQQVLFFVFYLSLSYAR